MRDRGRQHGFPASHTLPNRDFWEAPAGCKAYKCLNFMARPKGFEPLTPRFVVCKYYCSLFLGTFETDWTSAAKHALLGVPAGGTLRPATRLGLASRFAGLWVVRASIPTP